MIYKFLKKYLKKDIKIQGSETSQYLKKKHREKTLVVVTNALINSKSRENRKSSARY